VIVGIVPACDVVQQHGRSVDATDDVVERLPLVVVVVAGRRFAVTDT